MPDRNFDRTPNNRSVDPAPGPASPLSLPARADDNRIMVEGGVAAWVRRMAAGEVPLPMAFWGYAILYGLFVNGFASLAALMVVAAAGPPWLAALLFLLPIPYNLLIALGVWKSAGRWQGPPPWAALARLAIVVWTLAAIAL